LALIVSCRYFPPPSPLPPVCDARLFPIYPTCGGIVGFYVYTRLAFLSYRGSFALVVYTTVILISYSREHPARDFFCYRGVYIFLFNAPSFLVVILSDSPHQMEDSDGLYITLALDNSQPLRQHRQRRHRRRMDFQ